MDDATRACTHRTAAEQRRREWALLLPLLATSLLLLASVQVVRVAGRSMEPTFTSGQVVLVWKMPAFLGGYTPGDVIVFHQKEEGTLIKRVVFVQSPDGHPKMPSHLPTPFGFLPVSLLIDDTRSPYFPGYLEGIRAARNGRPINNTIYVMGDNFWNSVDSRDFGPISPDDVLGKVIFPVPAAADQSAPIIRRRGLDRIAQAPAAP